MDEAWNNFMVSGKVADYLICKESENMQTMGMNGLQKERPDGAEYCSDRNGLKCNADWRL